MAHQNFDGPYSLPAAADLSTHQYKLVIIDNAGKLNLCGANVRPDGILDNLPKLNEMGRFFSRHGVAMKGVAGGTIALGAKLVSDATGRLVTGASGQYCVGRALEAAVVGDVTTFFYDPQGNLP